MRCVLYARYSTDKQDELSIEVQLDECRRKLARRGWSEVAVYTDSAQSGTTMHRPGMQALLQRIKAGDVDVVFADAMDRLSRGQADIAALHERLRFRGIRIITRNEGEISTMLIGMKGTMNAEAVTITSVKTRDDVRTPRRDAGNSRYRSKASRAAARAPLRAGRRRPDDVRRMRYVPIASRQIPAPARRAVRPSLSVRSRCRHPP
ncbi:recombinase family protein [Sphingomonas solaris]|uniref:Recombinase family protein n=1 Tax=Alterirhizorhabdus solaris TaxID=2529389 RepID=A0A558RA40_9SPHN|nr:recombinase family protein [Sphingomonas solaris]